jgi:hypothetical protein
MEIFNLCGFQAIAPQITEPLTILEENKRLKPFNTQASMGNHPPLKSRRKI